MGALVFLGFVSLFLAAVIIPIVNAGKKKDRIKLALVMTPSFFPTHLETTVSQGIAIDEDRKSIAVASVIGGDIDIKTIPFANISGVDIERTYGAAITKKTGFTQFTTQHNVVSVTLCVTFLDDRFPIFRITFVHPGNAAGGSTEEKANEWHGLISSIIRRNQCSPDAAGQVEAPSTVAGRLSDELEALDRLRQQGILSDDEFTSAKLRLLSRA